MKMYDRALPYIDTKPVDTMSILASCHTNAPTAKPESSGEPVAELFRPNASLSEIKNMIENYGTRGIYFVGDNFTINKNRTQELCRKIKENKLDLKWTCETRADLVNKEVLSDMKSAGCQTIFIGVESGSERIQQKLNKNIDLQEVNEHLNLPDRWAYVQRPHLCLASQAKPSRTCMPPSSTPRA